LAFGTGIFIGVFFIWKYFFFQQRRNTNKTFNSFLSKPYSNQPKSERMLNIKNPSFAYKPLNDDMFVENQIDDRVIQVRKNKK